MIKRIIANTKTPIKLWLENIEDGALKQAENLSNLPFAFKHIAIMPDSHQGYGMPIGSILASLGVIIPNAVGVDIGCGISAIKTNIEDIDKETIKKIIGGSKKYQGGIRTKIPVGFSKHSKGQSEDLMPIRDELSGLILEQYYKALKSIGTLGGGNHFIEIQKGSDSFIWIMLHSGSRNLGKKVAEYHNNIAKDLNKRWFSSVPAKDELAFLPINSEDAKRYLEDMNYCIEFACANRKLMVERIKESFLEVLPNTTFSNFIDTSHNYTRIENHFKKNVWIHRKGAISARKDEYGIIPGSQGTNSYIVKGKGNVESFMSCSHGAGRLMSRIKARENLCLEDEIKKLDKQGIVHGVRTKNDLDEASGAYKNIDVVMENQDDLVDIAVKLTPLAVIKG